MTFQAAGGAHLKGISLSPREDTGSTAEVGYSCRLRHRSSQAWTWLSRTLPCQAALSYCEATACTGGHPVLWQEEPLGMAKRKWCIGAHSPGMTGHGCPPGRRGGNGAQCSAVPYLGPWGLGQAWDWTQKAGEGGLAEMGDAKLGGVYRCRACLREKGLEVTLGAWLSRLI